jgi:hypothetical protein
MAYIINKSDGTILLTLQDGIVDTSLSLGLVGKNYVGYGEIQNENFVYLLENFAGPNPPVRPLRGQTWYDSENQLFNFYNGESWFPVGAAANSETAPEGVPGAFWFNTITNQLFVFVNEVEGWNLIGPEAIPNFGTTRANARVLTDIDGRDHAALILSVNNNDLAICVTEDFEINLIEGFRILRKGINLSSSLSFSGTLTGNAATASKLFAARTINGIAFDGTENITITSRTSNPLIKGNYISGTNFDGSSAITWAVDATPDNIIGKVVARDSIGNFSANDITADNFIGVLKGNVDINIGTSYFSKIVCDDIEPRNFSGTSVAAGRLSPGRQINGVLFDGSTNITVTAAADTLTGSRISSNVKDSSLTTVGQLNSLAVKDNGVVIGDVNKIQISVSSNVPELEVLNGDGLRIKIKDEIGIGLSSSILFVPSLLASGNPALIPEVNSNVNLGLPNQKFFNVYADTFNGQATSAQYADLAENYLADADYEEGLVLEFGGDHEVTLAEDFSNKVAGVVSKKPAYLMNSDLQGDFVVSIALQGRVPCKVKGPVSKGDMIVSAGNGYARAEKDPKIGTVIGKSLEDFTDLEGTIEIAVGRL